MKLSFLLFLSLFFVFVVAQNRNRNRTSNESDERRNNNNNRNNNNRNNNRNNNNRNNNNNLRIRCQNNEVFRSCGTACEPTCENPRPRTCSRNCVPNTCQCASGYVRNKRNNRCIRQNRCPRVPTPPSFSCANVRCRTGYTCVDQSRPTCVPIAPTQLSITCANTLCSAGFTCVMEEQLCTSLGCRPARPTCVPEPTPTNPCSFISCSVGSICRVKNEICSQPPCRQTAECVRSQQCGRNEIFDSCGGCENTCFNKNVPCPAICNLEGKCRCAPGYFRFLGNCITESQCPRPTVLANQIP